jgi:hypothetical protein
VPVVVLLAVIAILIGVFVVATGRGGELAYEHADHAPLDMGPVSPTDVALLRPPTALWGYNMQVTDEALERIARALRDRDIEIAYLQRQLADLGHPDPGRPDLGHPDPGFADWTKPVEPALKTEADEPADSTAADPYEADPAEAAPVEAAEQPADAGPGQLPKHGAHSADDEDDDAAVEEQGW